MLGFAILIILIFVIDYVIIIAILYIGELISECYDRFDWLGWDGIAIVEVWVAVSICAYF